MIDRSRGVFLASLLVASSSAGAAEAPARFDARTLSVAGDVLGLTPADLDGDGRGDLLVPYKTGLPPREKRFLAVFWNQGRSYAARPDLNIPVDEATDCAYDVADVDGQRGEEILIVSTRGVTARALRGRKLAEAAALVEEPTLFLQPAPGELPRISVAQRLGADTAGTPSDLLVPAPRSLAIYRRSAGGVFERKARLDVAMEARGRSPYRRATTAANGLGPITASYGFPALVIGDADGDGDRDLVASLDDRVAIYFQGAGLAFAAAPSLRREFAVRTPEELTEMRAQVGVTVNDVDGDGVADVVVRKQVTRGIASATTTSFVHFGRRGGGFSDRADQVLRTEGASGTEIELIDVTGDGRADLVVPSVNIGVMAIIRILTTKTLKVNYQVFPFDRAARRFADKPAASRQLKFRVSTSGEADVQAASIRGNYNGDGRPDLAFGTDDDELSIYPGVASADLFAEDAVDEIPVRAFGVLEAVDLDRQGKSDILMYYPRTKGQRGTIVVLLNRGRW
jgi:hypothetical protein